MRRRKHGFTLLEVMIALGILAIGLTAALGLFTAAAASGRRAEQLVNASMLADSEIAEIEARLTGSFKLKDFSPLSPEDRQALDLDDPGPATPAPMPGASPKTSPDGAAPKPALAGSGGGETRVIKRGFEPPRQPGYKLWVLLTPLEGQGPDAYAFLCEVTVRWSRRRGITIRRLLNRRLTRVDIGR